MIIIDMRKVLSVFLAIALATLLLNINVSTCQGINYEVHTIKIPLYLKILDFFDRHYNYKVLAKRITAGTIFDEEKAVKLFEWTYRNIRKSPLGLPVVDDHAWHIIIRGYGVSDQSSDVFTTLCNYAGLDAFYVLIGKDGQGSSMPLALVKVKKRWRVFDPYWGVYFRNKSGGIADLEEIKGGNFSVEGLGGKTDIDYAAYLASLGSVKDIWLIRPKIQSPLNRFLFEFKKIKELLFKKSET